MLGAALQINELDRRLANIVRIGTIAEVDHGSACARVRFDEGWVSGKLPFAVSRSGAGGAGWHPPAPGEQVIVIAPDGNPEQGLIIASLYCRDHQPPDNAPHHQTLELPADGQFQIKIGPSSFTLSAAGLEVSVPQARWRVG